MRTRTAAALLSFALLAPIAAGGSPYDETLLLQPQSRLWVEGTSSVRSFECKAVGLDASVATSSPDAVNLVLAGAKAVSTVSVRVPARKLDCANGTMNGHMYKALKADAAPEIVFTLASYDLARSGETVAVKMNGTLSLGGTQKPIALEATAKAGPGGTLLVSGTEELRLSEFGLKAPSLMMGTMKVGDTVKVRYELSLKS